MTYDADSWQAHFTRNIICICNWKFNYPDLQGVENCKIKEKYYYYLADAKFEGKNTVESYLSLVKAKVSHFQLAELTLEQTDEMPAFDIIVPLRQNIWLCKYLATY